VHLEVDQHHKVGLLAGPRVLHMQQNGLLVIPLLGPHLFLRLILRQGQCLDQHLNQLQRHGKLAKLYQGQLRHHTLLHGTQCGKLVIILRGIQLPLIIQPITPLRQLQRLIRQLIIPVGTLLGQRLVRPRLLIPQYGKLVRLRLQHIPQHGLPLLVPVDLPRKVQPQRILRVSQRHIRLRLLIQLLGSLSKIQPQRIQVLGLLLGIQVSQHHIRPLPRILRIGTLVRRPLPLIIQLGQPVIILVLLLEETQLRHIIQISQRHTQPRPRIIQLG
jgi:hypothetical protein